MPIRFRVGCSGWQYKHWRDGVFYPPRLPQTKWLEYYARHFNTVEINNSFYRLPSLETFRSWQQRAPDGFVYAVKASRFLTHMKKLKDPAPGIERHEVAGVVDLQGGHGRHGNASPAPSLATPDPGAVSSRA